MNHKEIKTGSCIYSLRQVLLIAAIFLLIGILVGIFLVAGVTI